MKGSLIAHFFGENYTHGKVFSIIYSSISYSAPSSPREQKAEREVDMCGTNSAVSLPKHPRSDEKALFFPVCVNGSQSMGDSRVFSPHVLPPWGKHREVMWEGRDIDTTSISAGFMGSGAVQVTPA